MTYTIKANPKGTRTMEISDEHLRTIQRHALFSDLLDSNGIVDEMVLEKLRLNVRHLLESDNFGESREQTSDNIDSPLLELCKDVLFHDNMKAFALHQLISLYLYWNKEKEN